MNKLRKALAVLFHTWLECHSPLDPEWGKDDISRLDLMDGIR
jgi:hypothetical protein